MKYLALLLCFGISAPPKNQLLKKQDTDAAFDLLCNALQQKQAMNSLSPQEISEKHQFDFLSPEENDHFHHLLKEDNKQNNEKAENFCDLNQQNDYNRLYFATIISFIKWSNKPTSDQKEKAQAEYIRFSSILNDMLEKKASKIKEMGVSLKRANVKIDSEALFKKAVYKYEPFYIKFHKHFLNIFAQRQKIGVLNNMHDNENKLYFFNSGNRVLVYKFNKGTIGIQLFHFLRYPTEELSSALPLPCTTQSGFFVNKLFTDTTCTNYYFHLRNFQGIDGEIPFTMTISSIEVRKKKDYNAILSSQMIEAFNPLCEQRISLDDSSHIMETLSILCGENNMAFVPFPSKRTKARMLLAYLQPVLKAIKDKSKGARRRANKQAQKDEKKGDITSDEITTAHDISINESSEEKIATELTTNIENANAGIYTEITDEEIADAESYTDSDDAEYKAQIDILLDIYYSDINTQNKDIKKALAWVNTIIRQIKSFEHEENGKENAESFITSLANSKNAATSSSANDDDDDSGNQIQSNQISLPVSAGTLNPKQLSMALTELLQFKIDVSNADRTKGDHFMYVGKYGTATLAHRDEYHPGLVRQIMKQFASHFKGIKF